MDELYYQGTHSGPEIDALLDKVDAGVVPIVGKGINLLRNWYFVGGGSQQGGRQFPINERGQVTYSGNVYGIDRWQASNAQITVTVNAGNIRVQTGSGLGYNGGIKQSIEKSHVPDGTYTVSVLTTSGLNTKTGTVSSSASGYQISQPAAGVWFGFRYITDHYELSITASDAYIIAAKLELGDTQTLCRYENGAWVLNDPPPDFEEELFRCQTSHADSADTYANKSYATGNLIGKVLGNPAGQAVSVGEYAIVNNELYVCNTAITASMTPSTYMSYLTLKSGGGLNALTATKYDSSDLFQLVGTWDGAPLYRRIISGYKTTDAWDIVATTPASFNLGNIKKCDFYLISAGQGNFATPYYVDSTDMFRAQIQYEADGMKLYAQLGTSYPNHGGGGALITAIIYFTII